MSKKVDSDNSNRIIFFLKTKRCNYWLIYSAIWAVMALFTFSGLLFFHKSFIINSDGFTEYYVALKYFGVYLRQIFRDLVETHRIIIPDWDFCIGEGSDVLTTLHSYCIGDPLCLLSFFVPTGYTQYLFTAISLLRLYLAGVSFSALAFGTGQKNQGSVLAGAISYSLCYWGITCATGHPFMVIPMIFLPLMILGIEYILKGIRYGFFTIFTALSAISNLYLFYVTALLIVFYTLVRLFLMRDTVIKKKLIFLMKIAGCAFTGVCIASCILLPVAMFYKEDQRLSVGQPFHLFYPLYHYSTMPGSLMSASAAYAVLGLIVPVVMAVICLFFDKKDNRSAIKLLRALVVLSIVFILFPVFGRLFNLMSYATNRWIFAAALLGSYTLTYKWDTLLSVDKTLAIKIFIAGVIIFCLCIIFKDSRLDMSFAMLVLYFITTVLIYPGFFISDNTVLSRNRVIMIITFFNVILFGIWVYAPSFNNASKSNMTNTEITDKVASLPETMFASEFNTTAADNKGPLRVSGRNISRNANILNRFSSTQYYWSMTNSYVTSYRGLMELPDPSMYSFANYDDRTALTALSSTRYYITKEGNSIGLPYGFTSILTRNSGEALVNKYDEKLRADMDGEPTSGQLEYIYNLFYDPYVIFENEHALPITYCYDSYISRKEYEEMNPVSRQELLLRTCMVDDSLTGIDKYIEGGRDYSIPCTVTCNNSEITRNETAFITTAYNASADITFDAPADTETYIRMRGIDFTRIPTYDLYSDDLAVDPDNSFNKIGYDLLAADEKYDLFKERYHMHYDDDVTLSVTSASGLTKSFNYRTAEAPFSSGRHDYILNMGYNEDPETSFTLNFPLPGIYTIEGIEVYSIPMDEYEENINSLGQFHLNNVEYDVDSISGTIELDTPKILTAAIPFCKGWSAYIDGSPVKVLAVNDHYIGVEVPKGNHNVSFVYSTPYKKQGLILSFLGFAILAVMMIRCRES